MSGPVPKRSDQRRRRNAGEPITRVPRVTELTDAPAVLTDWHPLAADWYLSLARSGQAQYYEPSDWEYARTLAELLSRCLQAEKTPALLVTTVLSGMADLLVTEGARRRARMEIEKAPAEPPASIEIMSRYRRAAGVQAQRAPDDAEPTPEGRAT